MAEVAEHAGVGVGTVYRRFGSKDALVDALFAAKLDDAERLAEEAVNKKDPAQAFLDYCVQSSEMLAANKGLRQLMLMGGTESTNFATAASTRLEPHLRVLVDKAKKIGWLRESFSPSDLPFIMLAVHAAREAGGDTNRELWRRTLQMLFDGIRTESTTPIDIEAPPPLTTQQLAQTDHFAPFLPPPRRSTDNP